MKKILLGLLLLAQAATPYAQTLFSAGRHTVSKQTFLAAFHKNNQVSDTNADAYAAYLELYIRFVLKLQAAHDLGLDTLPSQQAELEAFRNQVIPAYLTDEATIARLTKQALLRSAFDCRISHIYIPFQGSDSLQAKEKAYNARAVLQKGQAFETVALQYSADPAVKQNKGDIGWISAFTLPYALETLAYETPLNSISPVFRSRQAYHIFSKAGERKSSGSTQVAQILLLLPASAKAIDSSRIALLADSIYTALQKGADFAQLAKRYSDDNLSYTNGGLLPPFYPGSYEPLFEDQANALKQQAISLPFRTRLGFHILKKISPAQAAIDTASETALSAMRSRVLNDSRSRLAVDAALAKAMQSTGFRKAPISSGKLEAFTKAIQGGGNPETAGISPNTALAYFPDKKILAKDYAGYLKTFAGNERPQEIFTGFLQEKVMEEYRQRLEKYNPAFAKQMQEFKEGNLIFEVMQQKVWNKALQDEAGLKSYYEKQASQYLWKESVNAIIFSSSSDSLLKSAHASLRQHPEGWKTLADQSHGLLLADSGRFETEQLQVYGGSALSPGSISSPVASQEDGLHSFVYVLGKDAAGKPRSFEEARAYVQNDYQVLLEEAWIQELKKKYPVKINQAVLKSLNR